MYMRCSCCKRNREQDTKSVSRQKHICSFMEEEMGVDEEWTCALFVNTVNEVFQDFNQEVQDI